MRSSSDKIFRLAYTPVVWSAGAPKLVLKGAPAQLQSHMGLSPGLIRFIRIEGVMSSTVMSVSAHAATGAAVDGNDLAGIIDLPR